MAVFHYQCSDGHVFRRLLSVERGRVECKCGQPAARAPTGASVSVYERLDNGLQSKATVRPADAERIFKEREVENDIREDLGITEADLNPIDDVGEFI